MSEGSEQSHSAWLLEGTTSTHRANWTLPPAVSLCKVIIHRGDIGEDMYFIARGAVNFLSSDEKKVISVASQGSFFGEVRYCYNQDDHTVCFCYAFRIDLQTLF